MWLPVKARPATRGRERDEDDNHAGLPRKDGREQDGFDSKRCCIVGLATMPYVKPVR